MTKKITKAKHITTSTSEEISAGGIVYKRSRGRFLIGFILDPYPKWIFPKGHLEQGEDTRTAAVRETKEEMGLKRLRIRASLGSIDFSFTRKKVRIHKVVHYYLMETSVFERGKPQASEKIRAIRWVGIRSSQELLGYANTLEVLNKAIAILKKKREEEKTLILDL